MWEKSSRWLQKAWWGVFIAHAIIFTTVYLGIWAVLEPMGVSDELADLPTFVKKRLYFHLIGTIVITAYMTIILLVFKSYRGKEANIYVDTYGLKINHPQPGSEIKGHFEISGTYLVKPPEGIVRILEFDSESHEYWPKNRIMFNDKNKTWSATVHSGGVNRKREFVVAYIGENGALIFKYFERVNFKTKEKFSKEGWIGINELPPDIIECDKVTVMIRPEQT